MGPGLVQTLPKAALVGGLVGAGIDLVGNGRGAFVVVSMVAAVALQSVAYFFGWGVAIGALCGSFLALAEGGGHPAAKAVGGIILGGMAGHLLGLLDAAMTGIPFVPIVITH